MHWKSIFTLVVAVLVAVDVQAQRRRRPKGDIYAWDLDLGDGTLVEQKAIVNSEANVTVVISRDPSLPENNLTKSLVLYDSIGIVAIKFLTRNRRIRSPCFLSVSTIPYDDLVGSVIERNGTQVNLPTEEITLNGTGEPVSRTETREIFRSVKSLRRFCRAGGLIQTSLATGDAVDADSEVKSILTLGGQENIIIPSTPTRPLPRPRPRPRPGNGGSRPRPRPTRPRPGNGDSIPRPENGSSRPPRRRPENDILFSLI